MVPLWEIQYYVSEDGSCPFEGFIGRLPTRLAKADCRAWIELLKLLGDTLDGDEHITHTRAAVHEIHDRSARIFYIFDGKVIVIIDGLLPQDAESLVEAIYRKVQDYAGYD